LRIPDNQLFLAAVMGALIDLTSETSWEPYGTMTPEDAAYMALTMVDDFTQSRGFCMIGAVFPYASASPPNFTLTCDGTTYLRTDYPDLYSVLDSAFIVDADHFSVPDLRGYTVVGANAPIGLSLPVASQIGEIEVLLDVSTLPTHSHTSAPHTHAEGTTTLISVFPPAPPSVVPAALGVVGATGPTSVTTDNEGAGNAHNNVQPSFGLSYCIVAK
jgi:microcystin-dependent protein